MICNNQRDEVWGQMRSLGENNGAQFEKKLDQNLKEMKGSCTSISKGLNLMWSNMWFHVVFTVLQTHT